MKQVLILNIMGVFFVFIKARTWKNSWRKSKPAGWLWQFARSSKVWDRSTEATTWGQKPRSWNNENWALCKTVKTFKGLHYMVPHVARLFNSIIISSILDSTVITSFLVISFGRHTQNLFETLVQDFCKCRLQEISK